MNAAFLLPWMMMGNAVAPEAPPPEKAPHWLELGVQAEYRWPHDRKISSYGGPGVQVQLLFLRPGPYFAFGPEAALYAHAGSYDLILSHSGPRGEKGHIEDSPLFRLGGVVRAGMKPGPLRLSFLLGAGWYMGKLSGSGLSTGIQLELRPAPWLPVILEARYHLSPYGGPALGGGSSLTW